MNFLKTFINFFSTITLGIIFVCAVNMSMSPNYDIPNTVLWQILLAGLVTSLLTVISIFLFNGINTTIKLIIAGIIHYIIMCIVMIGFGVWFDWMNFDAKGIIMMLISVAIVYLIAFLLNYIILKKEADDINSALEEHNKKS